LNTKEDIFKNDGNQTVAIDFRTIFILLCKTTVWLPTFFKILYLVFNRTRKLKQLWNNM